MNKVTDTVWALAEPIAAKNGVEIWDVEYVKEAGTWFLRVYLDKEGGISIDDCEAFSRALDPILDREDPIADSYMFEVSSAGLERTLKRPSDFEKFIGSLVAVKLYQAKDKRKEFVGKLIAYDDGAVTVEDGKGIQTRLEKNEVAGVRLRME